MSMDNDGGMIFTEETEELEKNLPQGHFIHPESHMGWSGCEPLPPRSEAGG
jgi:hypothetical protein